METLQTRFFSVLDARAVDEGLDLVVSYNYSNCGTLHFMRPDSFDSSLSIPFDIQTDRVTLGWMVEKWETRNVFPGRPNPHYVGFQPNELDEAIEALLEAAT